MIFLWGLLVGLAVGVALGVLAACLLVMRKRADAVVHRPIFRGEHDPEPQRPMWRLYQYPSGFWGTPETRWECDTVPQTPPKPS